MKRLLGLVAVALFVLSPVAEAGKFQPIRVEGQYREILGDLAAGRSEEALSRLIAFETETLGTTQSWRYVDNLWRAELRVIRDLLEDQAPDLLRPIVALHHDAYFEYGEMGRRYLAGHARTMAAELAEVYAKRMETAEASLFSGWILTSIGAQLWSPSGVAESADLFYRAYLVDPGNETALVGLAAAYEKNGDYPKAIEYLSQAVVRSPQDLEVRLRLAMCQLRLDDAQERLEAQTSLLVLTGDGSPDWIRSLAYQELGRAHLEEGKEKLAEERLRQGLAVLAGDQQLTLLLARILDGRRSRDEALSLLAAMNTDGWQQESPRERYDVWRPPGVEKARTSHLGASQQGLVALETGLMAKPAEAAGR